MALLQRIFSSKKIQGNNIRGDNGRRTQSSQKIVAPKLDKSKIRLVIYAESQQGRTPFFDSDAIKIVEDTEKTQNVMKSNPKSVRSKIQRENGGSQTAPTPKYHFSRLGNDVKVLEEMMFGAVALAFKGSTLKVHVLRSPNKVMLTKVFFPEKPKEDLITNDSGSESMSFPNSCTDLSSGEYSYPLRKPKGKARSIPVDVPSKEWSDCSTDDDSSFASFTSSGSLRASFPSPSNNSLSSYNSLHKRWMRAQTTSLDGTHRKMTCDPGSFMDGSGKRIRRHRLAVGILFGSYTEDDGECHKLFQSFIFSHFALVEGHLEKLCRAIEKAYFNNKTALPVTMEALDQFRNSIYDLYMAPRQPEPVWLTMMSTTTYRSKLCDKFMKEFNSLVASYDNKSHNFFVSTLLSAVLTQHLAWVATVSPAGGTPTKTYLDKHTAKWVDALAKTHPYNPLWAQLGDLYGAIGHPLKISRTVVIGKKADLVKRFLYLLSYFIRCSDMQECSCGQTLSQLITDSSHLEESLSPTLSEKTIIDSSCQDESYFNYRQASYGSSGGCVSFNAGSSGEVAFRTSYVGELRTKIDSFTERKGSDSMKESTSETPPLSMGSKDSINVAANKLNISHAGHASADYQTANTSQFRSQSTLCNEFSLKSSEADSVDTTQFDSIPLSSTSDSNSSYGLTSVTDPTSHEALSELHIYTPTSTPSCSLTPLNIVKSPRFENVQLVSRANVCDQKQERFLSENSVKEVVSSNSFSDGKIKSRLTQQLAASETSSPEPSSVKTSDLRKMFLSEGSSSMFDEYFEPGIEAKTVDDLVDSNLTSPSSQGNLSCSDNGRDSGETEVKGPYSRQSSSQDSRHLLGRPGSLPRSKSEIRRRHLSSTSSIDFDAFDPMTHCKEIKLPDLLWDQTNWSIRAFDRNFGRSLLASYTDHYMSDFVLHGTSDKDFKSRLLHDLQMAVQHSILDEPIDEAVCVIADTDNWTVEVASSKVMSISPTGSTTWMPSQLVADLIESVVEISKFKMGSEFCLMTIEDRLQEIYFKSIILSEYLNGGLPINQQELASTLSFDRSDMPLLLAVAGTHTPSLALGI